VELILEFVRSVSDMNDTFIARVYVSSSVEGDMKAGVLLTFTCHEWTDTAAANETIRLENIGREFPVPCI
jgi:hypothetical protein